MPPPSSTASLEVALRIPVTSQPDSQPDSPPRSSRDPTPEDSDPPTPLPRTPPPRRNPSPVRHSRRSPGRALPRRPNDASPALVPAPPRPHTGTTNPTHQRRTRCPSPSPHHRARDQRPQPTRRPFPPRRRTPSPAQSHISSPRDDYTLHTAIYDRWFSLIIRKETQSECHWYDTSRLSYSSLRRLVNYLTLALESRDSPPPTPVQRSPPPRRVPRRTTQTPLFPPTSYAPESPANDPKTYPSPPHTNGLPDVVPAVSTYPSTSPTGPAPCFYSPPAPRAPPSCPTMTPASTEVRRSRGGRVM